MIVLSKPGTWCDNVIIQAMSNAFNSIMCLEHAQPNPCLLLRYKYILWKLI